MQVQQCTLHESHLLAIHEWAGRAKAAEAKLAEQPAQQCRTDGRCQYAIDSGAEGMGHCPKGKCVMPAQQEPVTAMAKILMDRLSNEQAVYLSMETAKSFVESMLTSPNPAQRKPLTDEEIDAEFDAFASKFDHESNEWLDMGTDEYFRAGFKAAHNIKENA